MKMTKNVIIWECAGIPTVKKRIRYALENGLKLTQAEANRWPFCTSRLGARIYDLRKEGLDIKTKTISVKCADGHKAEVAEYSL